MSGRAVFGHVLVALAIAGTMWAYVAGLEAIALATLGGQ